MTILIENEADKELDFDYEKLCERLTEATLEAEKCPFEAELNILITNDEDIRLTNKEFRDMDRATDVLSFPMVDYEVPSDFSYVNKNPEAYLNQETGELILGDIMISADKVYSQAKEYGHGRKREFAFLIVHSLLHLLGYDHVGEDEAKIMEEKQENILNSLGITRNEAENE